METINKLRKFYHLKNVERACSVMSRKESSAEHSWSCLILADYFLNLIEEKLDRLKVYELLMYHDIVEIETGDVPIHHVEERKLKKEKERKAMEKMKEDFPTVMKEKIWNLFIEFEEGKTKEAQFAHAVDAFDSIIHELDYKEDWQGWTEEMVRKFHGEKIRNFSELQKVFDKILDFCKKEGYF
jgi:putative hydrolase of HD superfamily